MELLASGGAGGGGRETLATVPPPILPKGGGAIRGIGEKFSVAPATGTGSLVVPIPTSPGRSGFGPELALTYDSGAGNGPFGLGWSLDVPAVTRKTEKGLPRYADYEDSDDFLLSGAEDLVPCLKADGHDGWELGPDGRARIDEAELDGFRVRRYRPRTEGLFARIERWTRLDDAGDVHWRSISRDDVLTLYGTTAESRIADPDPARRRIFSWLVAETRDVNGNAAIYRYKAEDGAGVTLAAAHERNRGGRDDPARRANRYLRRIHYGNRTPLLDAAGERPRFVDHQAIEAEIAAGLWMFEVVFDYGEHAADAPKPLDAGEWNFRLDPFSSRRAGFEVRTARLCRRVLIFHHFEGAEGVGLDCLVRSTDFDYTTPQTPAGDGSTYSYLQAVTQCGYRRDGAGYVKRSLPKLEFEYSRPVIDGAVRAIDAASAENLPEGIDGDRFRWVDLHGEGITGILSEQGGAWYYRRNLSPLASETAAFGPLEEVHARPDVGLASGAEFMDLAGDGMPDLVVLDDPSPGLYEHDGGQGWQPFRSFPSRLNRDAADPLLRFVDLDGDGHADVLFAEGDALVWHPSLAEAGFGPARRVGINPDEERGPRLLFADPNAAVHLADMTGDGLADLVRVTACEVCYWPNCGHGRFGPKITMDNRPVVAEGEPLDPARVLLADIDGSGTADLIHLRKSGVTLYFNLSGNAWSRPHPVELPLRVDNAVSLAPLDLFGNGTMCLVWSSPLPGEAGASFRHVDLTGGTKPHLLTRVVNNLGAETRIRYASSTKFYLQDRRDGAPWLTRLPFPVHVVETVETYDAVSRSRFATRHSYHDGYFDGKEREFRGFGMVEQWDTESFAALTATGDLPPGDNIAAVSHVPPVHTKTWFHTGAYLGQDDSRSGARPGARSGQPPRRLPRAGTLQRRGRRPAARPARHAGEARPRGAARGAPGAARRHAEARGLRGRQLAAAGVPLCGHARPGGRAAHPAAGRQPARRLLHARPGEPHLPLRAEPGGPARRPFPQSRAGSVRNPAEAGRHHLRPPHDGPRRQP